MPPALLLFVIQVSPNPVDAHRQVGNNLNDFEYRIQYHILTSFLLYISAFIKAYISFFDW